MAPAIHEIDRSLFADNAEIRRRVAETNGRLGFVPDPNATVEKARAMMAAEGIQAEDNAFTAERMRHSADGSCRMTETMTREAASFFLDKTRIRQVVAEQNQKLGFISDPTVTQEEAQDAVEQSLRENGLRPEDNIFSCGIIAARVAALSASTASLFTLHFLQERAILFL